MKNKLIEAARLHGIDIEIREADSKITEITFLDDKITKYQLNSLNDYKIKAIKDGHSVMINTSNLSDIDGIITKLETIFAIQENKNKNKLTEGNLKGKKRKYQDLNLAQIKKDFLSLNDLKKQYPYLKTVESSFARYESATSVTNKNAKKNQENKFIEIGISVTGQKDDNTKIQYFILHQKDYDFQEVFDLIEEEVRLLELKLKGEECVSDKYKTIIKGSVLADLIGTFSGMFSSKAIDLKDSCLMDKFNQKVFSDKITIQDNPDNIDAIIYRYFDSEGTKTTKKVLIDKGVFVKKVNNLEYAIKNNEEPTGNADGITNLSIDCGHSSYQDLINNLENGVIIDALYGYHSGINHKNGDISLQASGLLVKDKKVVCGLENIILVSNIFELFNNVLLVGNDIHPFNATFKSPSILFDNVTIIGKKENKDE